MVHGGVAQEAERWSTETRGYLPRPVELGRVRRTHRQIAEALDSGGTPITGAARRTRKRVDNPMDKSRVRVPPPPPSISMYGAEVDWKKFAYLVGPVGFEPT